MPKRNHREIDLPAHLCTLHTPCDAPHFSSASFPFPFRSHGLLLDSRFGEHRPPPCLPGSWITSHPVVCGSQSQGCSSQSQPGENRPASPWTACSRQIASRSRARGHRRSPSVRGRHARRKAWLKGRRPGAITTEPGHAADEGSSHPAAYRANSQALNAYHPGPSKGEIHLFLTEGSDSPELRIKDGGGHVLGAQCKIHSYRGSRREWLP